MFDERRFWHLLTEKAGQLGERHGLEGHAEITWDQRQIVIWLQAPIDEMTGRRTDGRVWRFPFDRNTIWGMVERTAPWHAMYRPTYAEMATEIGGLLAGSPPTLIDCTEVVADEVTKQMGEVISSQVAHDLDEQPLRGPRPRCRAQ